MNATAKAAYTAGIIDGDGSISMKRCHGKKLNKNNLYWRIVIRVDNCNRNMIEWLCENWGGYIGSYKDKRPNRRPLYTWTIVGNDARRVIDAIVPFLIIKKEKATWAREVLRIKKEELIGGCKHTEESKAKLLELRRQFQNDPNRSLSVRNEKIY